METRTRTDKTASKGARTRLWFDWHSWLGVLAGLLLFVVCWSGTFATLAYEIDWLVNPDQRVTPEGQPASLEQMYHLVHSSQPEADIVAVIPPLYERFAAVVMTRQNQQLRYVYVDPYRLEITGSTPFLTVQRYLRNFHRRLFAGTPGFYLVCLMAFPLLASLVTGLVFYKRWWRHFFTFKLGKNFRALMSNLHKLTGLWSLWFVLVIGITGAWYLWESVRVDAVDGKFSYVDAFPSAVKPLPALEGEATERLPFSELLAIVRESRTDLDIGYVYLDRNGYFYAVGQADDWLVRDRVNKVFVDPFDGNVAYNQSGDDLNSYWYWSNMADPLHFGDFAGLLSKAIWFVFGLILSFLSISGSWLFARRLARNRKYRGKMQLTLAVSVLAALGVVGIAPLPLFSLEELGPTLNGVSQPAQLLPGVMGFIFAWILVTWGIAFSWIWLLVRPFRAKKMDGLRRSGAAA